MRTDRLIAKRLKDLLKISRENSRATLKDLELLVKVYKQNQKNHNIGYNEIFNTKLYKNHGGEYSQTLCYLHDNVRLT